MKIAARLRFLRNKAKRIILRHSPRTIVRFARRVQRSNIHIRRASQSLTSIPSLSDEPSRLLNVEQPRFNVRVGCILDEFSKAAWAPEFELVELDLTPSEPVLHSLDFLFVESAWDGNNGVWKNEIVGQRAKEGPLKKLTDRCRELGIPTVFWNKEDPFHFEDFVEAAKLFDVLATTDQSCTAKYRGLGNISHVLTMPFAAQPAIHNPARNGVEVNLDVGFGGTYFRHKFPERRRQMDILLGAAADVSKDFGFVFKIFSRHKGGPSRYQFPRSWSRYVQGPLSYDQMLYVYRSAKVMLNVNSVTSSPSMFSRRVFEIVGSGTPVLSTPSVGLERFFSTSEVMVADSREEASWVIRALVNSQMLRRRTSHIALRRIWDQHTYSHRAIDLLECLKLPVEYDQAPTVSIICSTRRPDNIDHLLQQVGAQRYRNLELVLVTHGFELDEELISKAKQEARFLEITTITAAPSWTLGDCLNAGVEQSSGKIVAKFDDDDLYFPNYLVDQVNALMNMNADLVGKASINFYLPSYDAIVRRWPHREHSWYDFVSGSTFVGWRNIFLATPFKSVSRGEDSQFLMELVAKGQKVYSSDSFNYLCIRGGEDHTWTISESEILANSTVECMGFNLSQVEI